jgi:hypothetical protein
MIQRVQRGHVARAVYTRQRKAIIHAQVGASAIPLLATSSTTYSTLDPHALILMSSDDVRSPPCHPPHNVTLHDWSEQGLVK